MRMPWGTGEQGIYTVAFLNNNWERGGKMPSAVCIEQTSDVNTSSAAKLCDVGPRTRRDLGLSQRNRWAAVPARAVRRKARGRRRLA